MALVTDRLIYIHVQKTGGMAVRRALHACAGCHESGPIEAERHIGLPELRVTHPGIDNNRIVFGFVRHPVAWIRSRWAFAMASGYEIQRQHRPSAAALWINSCWDTDFSSFVDKYIERYPGIATQTMFRMLGLWSDAPAHIIGRTESLRADLAYVLTYTHTQEGVVAKASAALSQVNKTPDDVLASASVSVRMQARIESAEKPLMDRYYGSVIQAMPSFDNTV